MIKSGLKKVGIYFSSIFLFILHLPFVFARSKPNMDIEASIKKPLHLFSKDGFASNPVSIKAFVGNNLLFIYDSLRLNVMGLSKQAFSAAIKGYSYLVQTGKIANSKILSIVDFSLPSYKKRLFVLDIKNHKVLFNTYVAHGSNSGREFANNFSNIPETNKSSLGFYATTDTYLGKNGYSLHLNGLEYGINSNATKREIVMHGADYVSETFIRNQGCIGRSWGCPAIPMSLHKPIIDRIKNGTCLFIYSSSSFYLKQSRILNHS